MHEWATACLKSVTYSIVDYLQDGQRLRWERVRNADDFTGSHANTRVLKKRMKVKNERLGCYGKMKHSTNCLEVSGVPGMWLV